MEEKRKVGRPRIIFADDKVEIKKIYNRRHYEKKKGDMPRQPSLERKYYYMRNEYDIDPVWIERYKFNLVHMKKLQEIKQLLDADMFISMCENCEDIEFKPKY